MSFTNKNKDELQRILLEVLIVLALVALLVLAWPKGLLAFKTLVGSALVAILAFLADFSLGRLEKRLNRWGSK